jgi:hypothetical protein
MSKEKLPTSLSVESWPHLHPLWTFTKNIQAD